YCVTGKHRQMDEVRSGGSYLSQNELRLHFGLGAATKVDSIKVLWPSGAVDELRNAGADQILTITEGSSAH
ncbi:MAG TPA: ASPIC/UnbV domain-containing protein, partial [Bryobacteraceae bacterium]|nr:ASPIC/UnbV domain-containing protein [Bryobacteraceae bacterium]